MARNEKARQPRGGAGTGPVGKPCVQAGSPDHPSTAAAAEHDPSRPEPKGPAAPGAPLTEAEVLVGVVSWLAAAHGWFEGELALARARHGLGEGEEADDVTLTLSLDTVAKLTRGLGNAVAHLDRLSLDPARTEPVAEAAPQQRPGGGWLQ